MAARRRTRGYKRAHARGGRLTSGANSIASGSDAGCQPPGSACDYGLGRRTPYQHGLSAGSSGPRLASLVIGLVLYSGRLRASVRHTDARWGYGQAKLRGRVFRVQRRSQTDRSPAWPGIESTDSSADRPPLTGPQHINIRWKAQGLRFPRPEAQESRNGSSTNGHDRSLVFLSPLAISRPTPLVPEQQRQHASVVPPI